MNKNIISTLTSAAARKEIITLLLVAALPLVLGVYAVGIVHWDLSVPIIYRNSDDIWQLVLTKVLRDTGWILTNPFLGAPDIASWHHNAAAQTSALHSVIMLGMSYFINDAVRIQQLYFLLNFSLIPLSAYAACRLLGINRILGLCIAILFAFTTFRMNEMLYAFLSNYFMVPLALVPIVWIIAGTFKKTAEGVALPDGRAAAVKRLLVSWRFWLGFVFIVLTVLADGYYAFFTLLLLGFAVFVRLIRGDYKSPISLIVPVIYIASVICVSTLLFMPLYNYKQAHLAEFYPGGVEDPALAKHAFEAEVYSSSMKLLIAPIPKHRIRALGDFGNWMVETSDGARLIKNGRNLVPLGAIGSIIFLIALAYLAIPGLARKRAPAELQSETTENLPSAFLSLILFIFLCSIVGGIGTLVALVFPTIRSYDRFPLFLLFVLYLAAGFYLTRVLNNMTAARRLIASAILILITIAGLYDQIPYDSAKGEEPARAAFLAERQFVRNIEATVPAGSMIYQYPYSQYLRYNEYYGWGSFSHVRLYLHSKNLRWSNGGAKNSPADDWNLRISQLPLDEMLNEIEAAGFKGFAIDRTVVSGPEYAQLKAAFEARGMPLLDDAASHYAFAQLKNPGYRLEYDPSYTSASRLEITDRSLIDTRNLSNLLNAQTAKRLIDQEPAENRSFAIEQQQHPEAFTTAGVVAMGNGEAPISQLGDVIGSATCKLASGGTVGTAGDVVILTLTNQSAFDWRFNTGTYPLGFGVHIKRMDGTILRFDDGLRLAKVAYRPDAKNDHIRQETLSVRRGMAAQIAFPLSQLDLNGLGADGETVRVDFRMVQDGKAWLEHIGCDVVMSR